MPPMVEVVIPQDVDAHTEHRPLFGRPRQRKSSAPEPRWTKAKTPWIFARVVRGELGLGSTFWMWGVVYSIPVAFLAFALFFAAIKSSADAALSHSFLVAAHAVNIGWGLFIGVALLNAAKASRAKGFIRGFWGWAATACVAVSFVMMPVNLYKMWNPTLDTWEKVEMLAVNQSLAAPTALNEVLTLKRVTADEATQSMTWHIEADVETIDATTFDASAIKNEELRSCPDLKIYFNGPVETLFFSYSAHDGSVGQIRITEDDCVMGHQPVVIPTETAQVDGVDTA
ncbi:MAG: hypothetical protein AAFV45_15445 [Pseudomonadota bacterium]